MDCYDDYLGLEPEVDESREKEEKRQASALRVSRANEKRYLGNLVQALCEAKQMRDEAHASGTPLSHATLVYLHNKVCGAIYEYVRYYSILSNRNYGIARSMREYAGDCEDIFDDVSNWCAYTLSKNIGMLWNMSESELGKYIRTAVTNALISKQRQAFKYMNRTSLIVDDMYEDCTPMHQFASDEDLHYTVQQKRFGRVVLVYISQHLSVKECIALLGTTLFEMRPRELARAIQEEGYDGVLEFLLARTCALYNIDRATFEPLMEKAEKAEESRKKEQTIASLSHVLSNNLVSAKNKCHGALADDVDL